MTPDTYTLSQLHAHASAHGYQEEAERLEHYLELQRAENDAPPLRPRPAVSKQWDEALAAKRAAA